MTTTQSWAINSEPNFNTAREEHLSLLDQSELPPPAPPMHGKHEDENPQYAFAIIYYIDTLVHMRTSRARPITNALPTSFSELYSHKPGGASIH